jgi:predicted transcriptional regulator YdeE
MESTYGYDFYKDRHRRTLYSANKVLEIVIDTLPEIRSAVDFGCGVGTWLSVLKSHGVSELQGLDGPWVKSELLEISKNSFRQINFEEPIELNKRYDLAITLEVAEHLTDAVADKFVSSLVRASDFILFSAAIPHQGGDGHVNEQWPDYWSNLFAQKGYVALDFIRSKIWDDRKVPIWYRQNIFLFVKKDRLGDVNLSALDAYGSCGPISVVHPETYLQMVSLRGSFKLLLAATKNKVANLF